MSEASSSAGYSGTPLVKKLGIEPGHRVAVLDEPAEFRSLLVGLGADVRFRSDLRGKPDVVIGFFTEAKRLSTRLEAMARAVEPDRMVWVAWPKKTSGVTTDLTGDVVRAAILSTVLVDVKVCAISDIWSGLKAVWRTEHRR